MRSPIVLISLSTALFGLMAPGLALATPNFPDALKTDLGLTYTPPCTVCHNNPGGGTGTVTQAFGVALRKDGLLPGDTDSLQAALKASETAKTDSDCDGVIDVDQLKAGRDPTTGAYIDGSGKTGKTSTCSTSGSSGGAVDTPEYGCGAHLAAAPRASAWQSAAAVAALLGLSLFRRRRG